MNNIAEKDSLLIVNNKTREDMRSRSLWNEHYTYTDYVFDTYGHETPVVSFTDRLLSQYFIDNAMKEVSVGIVRDINPVLSLSGAVKTNINNFSGTDTLTGLLANQLHAAALYNGSQINTLRRDNHMMNGQFISKNMDSVYGNTVSNISRLGSMLEISKETGRIPGEISSNLGEVTFDKIENGIDNSVNFNTKYLAETLSYSSFYNPTSPYLKYEEIDGHSIEHFNKDNNTSDFNFNNSESNYKTNVRSEIINPLSFYFYNEGGVNTDFEEYNNGELNIETHESIKNDNFNNNELVNLSNDILKDKLLKLKEKGINKNTIRALVVGIPNAGKSTLINKIVGKKIAVTGNKPGVTKNLSWVRVGKNIELLDSPGILWPKLEQEKVAFNLASTTAIKEDILPKESVCVYIIKFLYEYYKDILFDNYGVENIEDFYEVFEVIGKKKGFLSRGGIVDDDRVVNLVLNDIKSGKIKGITFDRFDDYEL